MTSSVVLEMPLVSLVLHNSHCGEGEARRFCASGAVSAEGNGRVSLELAWKGTVGRKEYGRARLSESAPST